MAAEISIPVEWLLGTLIVILSALFALSFKNTRCIARMEGDIKGVKAWITDHKKEVEGESERLREVENDIARLEGLAKSSQGNQKRT